jgi:hypothetical protein
MKYKLLLLIGLVTGCVTGKHTNDLKDPGCIDKLDKARIDLEIGVTRTISSCYTIAANKAQENCLMREIARALNTFSLQNNAYFRYTETVPYEEQSCDELVGILNEVTESYLR